ncbi:MAG: copper resistance CopC family protein, partial [Pyrinomonadaceae bacterium]
MNKPQELTSLILLVVSLIFGLTLLLFGLGDLLIPRARFVSSSPEPGATVAAPPTRVIVRFSNDLSMESQVDVVSTVRVLPSGEHEHLNGKSVIVSSGIDADDPSGKSMRADLRPDLHPGLYFINWRTSSAGWKAMTFGRTSFGVGMPVPEHITRDLGGKVLERTNRWRGRRAALIGGVILLALA